MAKSATDIMQQILFSAVLDAVEALKKASGGLPNTLLRDLNTIHANTAFGDLPPALQASIQANVREAFTRLQKDGYAVSPAGTDSPRRPPAASPGAGGARGGPRGDNAGPPRGRPSSRPPRGPGTGGRKG